MKTKNIVLFAATAASLVSSAYSQTVIDICGSTAGRSAVYTQILALVNETSTAGSGSSLSGSNQAIIHGTYAGNPVIVRTNFTGSAAGVQQVSSQVPVNFFKTTFGTSGFATSQSFASPNIETSAPEIGYSDVFQSTTAFKTPVLTVEDEVAVIPFKFFRHTNGNASLTNVTNQAARYLYGSGGSAPLSILTGNALDVGKTVYVTGRDALSGTRITTFAEINTSQTAVSQYQPTTSATNGTGSVTGLGSTSSGGFTSGSFVANVLNSDYDGTGNSTIIGYVGASDWPAQVPGNAVEVNFNGVPYSSANLFNGSYTFWGYLHQFRMTLTGTSLNFYNALASSIAATPGSGLEKISDMKVVRDGDGAPVNPILE
jgi:hypothetical protein